MARAGARAWWAGLAALWMLACTATVLLVDDRGGESILMLGEQQHMQMLKYKTYVPEENPLEDFDSDFKQGKYKEFVPESNPLAKFEGYGFSTRLHPKGVSPYPPTPEGGGYDTHNVFDDIKPENYPFDERKPGLKEAFHKWQHWDWKKSPPEALREPNVYDGPDIKDSAWQLNDKMSFKWHHWGNDEIGEDAASKALKETNVYDNPKDVKYPAWKNTPSSTVQDAQTDEPPAPGQEANVMMNVKFPGY